MNAAQPPLQHGPGQPHDLQQHQQPMIQFHSQQMRPPIMPPAPAGPFPPGPQHSLYPQHRQVPPPNAMMMGQSMPRMMAPNGIPPPAMAPASIPFTNTVRRQPMPGYPQFTPNGLPPGHPHGHPQMFRPVPGEELNRMGMRIRPAPTVPGPMGPLALPGGALPGANHAIMANNQLPTGHPLPPRQSLPSPARSPLSQPPHSAAQTPTYTGPGGYVPAASMTPAAPTPRPQTAGLSYQQTRRPSISLDGIPDPSGLLPSQIMDQSVPMEGLAGDASADVMMQHPRQSQTPRPTSQAGSLSGPPTAREMSLARDSTHAHSSPHPPHPSVHPSKPYASSQVMALSADLSLEAPGKETDEYWRGIVSKHFAREAVMTISLPKGGPPEPNHLGHTAIAQIFKAIWASGVASMSFSIDGAREYERRTPGGPLTFVLCCTQARWRMHYFSGYMVELHGTLKVVCVLGHCGRAWRVQIQEFDLECLKDVTWLAKTAIAAGRFLGPMQRRSTLSLGAMPGVGADAECNRFVRQGEVIVPTTPLTRFGLPESAIRTMEMHDVLSDMASVMDYDTVHHCGPRVAMEQIVNGASIPQLVPFMPNAFPPLYPPSYMGANQLGYSLPSQPPPLHQPLQTPQQQPQHFQQQPQHFQQQPQHFQQQPQHFQQQPQHFQQQPQHLQQLLGAALPVGVSMRQMHPPPGASDHAPQRPMAPQASSSINNSEPAPLPISGPLPIARPASAAATPQNATPKLGKRTPGSPSKTDQRKRGEAETPAGNEASSERVNTKRKAPTQQVGDSDTPAQTVKRPRRGRK